MTGAPTGGILNNPAGDYLARPRTPILLKLHVNE
jgi:hypothetical protein